MNHNARLKLISWNLCKQRDSVYSVSVHIGIFLYIFCDVLGMLSLQYNSKDEWYSCYMHLMNTIKQ